MAPIEVALLSDSLPVKSSARLKAERLFHPAAAVLMLAIALYGFHHFFFRGQAFPGRPLTPPIRALLIVHGLGQLAWLLLFIAQPTLVALRKRKLHKMLGRFGAALAVTLVVMGYLVAVRAARVNPPDLELFAMRPPQFLYVPLTAISVFAVFVALAIWQRNRPDLHRALMLTATVAASSASMGRIAWLNDLVIDTAWFRVFGPLHSSVMLGLFLLAARLLVVRRFDRPLALSVAAMAAVFAVMHQVSATNLWNTAAHILMG